MAGNICRRESNRNFEMKNTVSLPRIGSRHYFNNVLRDDRYKPKSKKHCMMNLCIFLEI